MRSSPLSAPAALELPDTEPGRARHVFKVCALTPIYKGGANPKGIDRDRPFRGSSLRGHLRFWWRAGSEATTVEDLHRAERSLWGGVFGEEVRASRVRVGFTEQDSRPARKPSGLQYVLWPHDPKKNEGDAFHAEGANARLAIDFPTEDRRSVERSLSAWLLLGGVGGRTRRGLGKVWHEGYPGLPERFDSTDDWLDRLRRLAPPAQGEPSWPSLAGALVVVGPPCKNAMAAWKQAVDMMQSVRMSGSGGANPPLPRVPRPPALRSDFPKLVNGEQFTSARASLGLPIQFRTDEGTISMQPAQHNRFPSPVFFALVPLQGEVAPAMVALSTPFPESLNATWKTGKKPKAVRVRGLVDPGGVRLFMEAAAQGWRRTVHRLGGTP